MSKCPTKRYLLFPQNTYYSFTGHSMNNYLRQSIIIEYCSWKFLLLAPETRVSHNHTFPCHSKIYNLHHIMLSAYLRTLPFQNKITLVSGDGWFLNGLLCFWNHRTSIRLITQNSNTFQGPGHFLTANLFTFKTSKK